MSDRGSELFVQEDLPLEGFPIMEQIRSDSRLCDIKLKVHALFCIILTGLRSYVRREIYKCCFFEQVEDVAVDAHRIVLAATIPYFHAMFTTDMKESKQSEITLQGMDGKYVL